MQRARKKHLSLPSVVSLFVVGVRFVRARVIGKELKASKRDIKEKMWHRFGEFIRHRKESSIRLSVICFLSPFKKYISDFSTKRQVNKNKNKIKLKQNKGYASVLNMLSRNGGNEMLPICNQGIALCFSGPNKHYNVLIGPDLAAVAGKVILISG